MNPNRRLQIELFAFDSLPSFLNRTGRSEQPCWYGVLKLSYEEQEGFGVCIISEEAKCVDLIKWGTFLMEIRNHSPQEVLEIVHHNSSNWSTNQLDLVQSALLDLAEVKYQQHKMAVGSEIYRGRFHSHSQTLKTIPKVMLQRQHHCDPDMVDLTAESTAYYSII